MCKWYKKQWPQKFECYWVKYKIDVKFVITYNLPTNLMFLSPFWKYEVWSPQVHTMIMSSKIWHLKSSGIYSKPLNQALYSVTPCRSAVCWISGVLFCTWGFPGSQLRQGLVCHSLLLYVLISLSHLIEAVKIHITVIYTGVSVSSQSILIKMNMFFFALKEWLGL